MFPAAFFLPFPAGAWGWLAASAGVHLVYLVCLIKSFEAADMSVAYPIARGAAPTLAAAVAVALFDEPITAWIACAAPEPTIIAEASWVEFVTLSAARRCNG
jgi:hypothetical protein